MRCQIQIGQPRNHITNCVGNINIDEKIEKIVYTIMNSSGNQTNYGKPNKLPNLWGDIQSLELACQNCSHILMRPPYEPQQRYNFFDWASETF